MAHVIFDILDIECRTQKVIGFPLIKLQILILNVDFKKNYKKKKSQLINKQTTSLLQFFFKDCCQP